MDRFRLALALALVAITFPPALPADPPVKDLPVRGESFLVDGRTGFVIDASLNSAMTGKPWVWYAPTLPGLPGKEERWMFEQFLDAGISIAGIDVGESFGSPTGRRLFDKFHDVMTARGYSTKPILLGRSRGGLMTLSWAVENPDKVGGFAGIYPVCNVASYPGIAKAAPAFQMPPEELRAHLQEHNPIDRLAALAKAGVPLFAIHGDEDTVVPLTDNSGLMRSRYVALGGSMQLIVPPGQGHNMWPGFFQCRELVEFVRAHAGPNLHLDSPRDFQVLQRANRNKGMLRIKGDLAGVAAKQLSIEARVLIAGKPSKWHRVAFDPRTRTFDVQWTLPAGGWHQVQLRVRSDYRTLGQFSVQHVGVGEVFVIAGQSNSANHGAEKQITKTGLVSSFDGAHWQLANDPQPGASGDGGSFIPPFGDAIARRFGVPVGIVACGVGATSVREWLPKGARFPNPPTLKSHVRPLPDESWESKGTIFTSFTDRIKPFGPHGFRAVLWHQGESDAKQANPTNTLPGNLYRECLTKVIDDVRHEIGWPAPWFVAQASYHRPGDEGSEEIRAAQSSLWKDGIALAGPDTDALKANYRDSNGQGVHFSGPGLREHALRWLEKVAPWLAAQR